jgi:flagellar FliL protein
MNDLTDPVLGLIKRKILEKTNRLLGKAMVKGVVFSDFSYYEQ